MEIQSLQPEIKKLQELPKTLTKFMQSKYITPMYVGSYILGEPPYTTKFNLTVKPSWLNRKCMSIFFGFKWEDIIDMGL
jgi:hypothetical protein